MLLSDLLKTTMADSLGDIDTLMKAAEGLDVVVHIRKSPVPIAQLDAAIAIVNNQTNRFVCETPVTSREKPLPRDDSQAAYWEVNHNPWLD